MCSFVDLFISPNKNFIFHRMDERMFSPCSQRNVILVRWFFYNLYERKNIYRMFIEYACTALTFVFSKMLMLYVFCCCSGWCYSCCWHCRFVIHYDDLLPFFFITLQKTSNIYYYEQNMVDLPPPKIHLLQSLEVK